jgi:hypothetical protein
MDEARIGQKGRKGHRWWPKGTRVPVAGAIHSIKSGCISLPRESSL